MNVVPTGESTHGIVPNIDAYKEPRKEVDSYCANENRNKMALINSLLPNLNRSEPSQNGRDQREQSPVEPGAKAPIHIIQVSHSCKDPSGLISEQPLSIRFIIDAVPGWLIRIIPSLNTTIYDCNKDRCYDKAAHGEGRASYLLSFLVILFCFHFK